MKTQILLFRNTTHTYSFKNSSALSKQNDSYDVALSFQHFGSTYGTTSLTLKPTLYSHFYWASPISFFISSTMAPSNLCDMLDLNGSRHSSSRSPFLTTCYSTDTVTSFTSSNFYHHLLNVAFVLAIFDFVISFTYL